MDRHEDEAREAEDKKHSSRMGFLDVVAFTIAAFQILAPYMLALIITAILGPALLFLLMHILGR